MRTPWHHLWGSARGPAKKLAPQARIICGACAFAVCMISPAASPTGIGAVAVVMALWWLVARPPAAMVGSTLLLGLVLFVPYFLLVPLIKEQPETNNWYDAFTVTWVVFFKGMTAMQVSVWTATTLSASGLRKGLSRLPMPEVVSAVLIQIVHQTATLFYETRSVAAAIAVRGGTTGIRTAIRILASIPRVWLPRVVTRAERVGAAMELRGYLERDLGEMGVVSASAVDALAVGMALVAVVGVAALRLFGGELW